MFNSDTACSYAKQLVEELLFELKRTGVTPVRAANDLCMSYVGFLHIYAKRRVPTLYWTVRNIEDYIDVLKQLPNR